MVLDATNVEVRRIRLAICAWVAEPLGGVLRTTWGYFGLCAGMKAPFYLIT
jgi:hypothetical protein